MGGLARDDLVAELSGSCQFRYTAGRRITLACYGGADMHGFSLYLGSSQMAGLSYEQYLSPAGP